MENIKIFGEPIIEDGAIDQLKTCVSGGSYGVLTADAHIGYGHPIGGAVAYKDKISLSGVGFDIACGNKAVRTTLKVQDVQLPKVMDEIERRIAFGMGVPNQEKVDHPVLDKARNLPIKANRSYLKSLFDKARTQLGSVGGGNHFVDLFRDEEDYIWIGVHFGSRGFGHSLTTGFIAVARGHQFGERVHEGGMFSAPILFDVASEVGQDYLECLQIAGEYAYAGRDWVVERVLRILDNPEVTYSVHNHHNFAWYENHFSDNFWVVRKGCTPAFPGQAGFIGSNMFDTSVVVEGVDSPQSESGLFSTVHGAGRVMSRSKAKGKGKWKRDRDGVRHWVQTRPGAVDYARTLEKAKSLGIELRGGGADESPECYKKLEDVLTYQGDTIRVVYRLKPIGVVMAGD